MSESTLFDEQEAAERRRQVRYDLVTAIAGPLYSEAQLASSLDYLKAETVDIAEAIVGHLERCGWTFTPPPF